jgi:hypothetical protein
MVRGDPLRLVKGLDIAYSVQTCPERTRDNISYQPLRHNLRKRRTGEQIASFPGLPKIPGARCSF